MGLTASPLQCGGALRPVSLCTICRLVPPEANLTKKEKERGDWLSLSIIFFFPLQRPLLCCCPLRVCTASEETHSRKSHVSLPSTTLWRWKGCSSSTRKDTRERFFAKPPADF